MNIIRFISFALICGALGFSGCSTSKTMALNSVELTNQLRPGMSYDEVVEILGTPKSSKMDEDNWIARWNLQEMWKGYIPYDFVFNPEDQTLISWSENKKAFDEKQEQLKLISDAVEEAAKESEANNNSSDASTPNITNDPELMKKFAAYYYSFSGGGYGSSGSSERKVTLCPNGRYISSSESSYSGGAGTSGAWGTANQGGGDGSWKISGTMDKGIIVMTSNSGKSTTYNYTRCGSDCVYFGNNKFAVAGVANCK